MLLRLVARLDRVQYPRRITQALSGLDQGADVFGKTTAAIASTWVNEVVANALIAAYALAHRLDVRAHQFGDIGHFIHETDLGGQHAVGSVFGQFSTSHIHDNHFVMVAVKGFI